MSKRGVAQKRVVQVTQRVSLADVDDLLVRPPRAALAFAGPSGPECIPVVVRRHEGIHLGARPDAIRATGVPERVALVVDDGRHWFELRAAVWQGTIAAVDDDLDAAADEDGLIWFVLDPRRVAAWDCGRLHEVV